MIFYELLVPADTWFGNKLCEDVSQLPIPNPIGVTRHTNRSLYPPDQTIRSLDSCRFVAVRRGAVSNRAESVFESFGATLGFLPPV